MKVKMVRDYKCLSCGFPVTIEAIAIGNYRGNEIPLIDYYELDAKVLMAVAVMPRRLTGREIRFIRSCAFEGYAAFAAHFGVTPASVIGWEKHGDEATNMNLGTEILIRSYALILAGAGADPMADLLTKFILLRDDTLKSEQTAIRVAINTDPSTFDGKAKTGSRVPIMGGQPA